MVRSEVTGVLRGIDDESSKFSGLGCEVGCGDGLEIGSGVGSRWGLYTHCALLLHEDHEIAMLRKLEPCLFTQEELNRNQQRECVSSVTPSQEQHSNTDAIADGEGGGIVTGSPGILNHTTDDTHNQNQTSKN